MIFLSAMRASFKRGRGECCQQVYHSVRGGTSSCTAQSIAYALPKGERVLAFRARRARRARNASTHSPIGRKHMIRLILPLAALVAFTSSLIAQAKRPNIVFIMADDHAAHAISAYGSKINKTPNIDRLAKDGMRFRNCFVTNSICTPSRAVILTGKYSHLNGVPVFNRFDGRQPTLAKYLQAAGYHTGMIGKWHLGSEPTGFDHWNILPGQGAYHDPVFLAQGTRKKHSGYCTDLIADFSLKFLDNRPKDKPFFL